MPAVPGLDRDRGLVHQFNEVLQFTLLAVQAVVVPANDPIDLPVFHIVQHCLVRRTPLASKGTDVVISVQLGDLPAQALSELAAIVFLAGYT